MLKIGVMDSGVGGLTIFKAIQDRIRYADMIYFADQKYSPYGNLPAEKIVERLLTVGLYFEQQLCDVMVVACNTATVVGIKALREKLNIPVVGVEPAVKPACKGLQARRVSVLATPVTANSERLNALISEWRGDSIVEILSSSVLAQLIDHMPKSAVELEKEVEHICQLVVQHQSSALVLACTHYPLIRQYFERSLSPNSMEIVEPSKGVAAQVERILSLYKSPLGQDREVVLTIQSNGSSESIVAMSYWLSHIRMKENPCYVDI
ncbi:glutamate racemase [Marinomonas piezotolerans]|uniref:Glutamate racemase n=1 Tax=Marinomonas piezotolerans TaxID=2213058 RepID=A0A370UDN2_9GAMM|nr:glutamate racemase [Marinomonas piezotolerans]RDL45897.1 glutamate racemase [Marinomonas piezotolerans]